MIRSHVRHIHHTIGEQSIPIRAVIPLTALLSLPVFGTGVRALGSLLGFGQFVLPLLVLAHVPVLIAPIAVWSIGRDLCRTEGPA